MNKIELWLYVEKALSVSQMMFSFFDRGRCFQWQSLSFQYVRAGLGALSAVEAVHPWLQGGN